jgi:hypothetical protein
MFKAASKKLGLDYAVMHNMNSTSVVSLDSKKDMDSASPEDDDIVIDSVGSPQARRGSREAVEGEGSGASSEPRIEHQSQMSKKELESLLKHGAYDIFQEEQHGCSDQESNRFYEDDIETILQRSAVMMHDEQGQSKLSKVSSSFAKASFVPTADLSSSASNEIVQLDDPDFWSKVVGITTVKRQQEQGRKRKCAVDVSYREPGESIKELSADFAFDTSINWRSKKEKAARAADRANRKEEVRKKVYTAPVFSFENLSTLSSSLCSRGLGNWELIRSDSKLNWCLDDIVKGCRLSLLMLLFLSASISNAGEQFDSPSDCQASFRSHLSSFRACRLAILSEIMQPSFGITADMLHLTLPAHLVDEDGDIVSDMVACFETDLLSVLSQTGQTVTLPLSVEKIKDSVAAETSTGFVRIPQSLQFEAVEEAVRSQIRSVGDSAEFPTEIDHLSSVICKWGAHMVGSKVGAGESTGDTSAVSIEDVEVPADGSTASATEVSAKDKEKERNLKLRSQARAKLLQVEDLFDILICTNRQSEDFKSLSNVESTDEPNAAAPHVRDHLRQHLEDRGAATKMLYEESVPGWNLETDLILLDAVRQVGWPEGKRKLAAIAEIFRARLGGTQDSSVNEGNCDTSMDVTVAEEPKNEAGMDTHSDGEGSEAETLRLLGNARFVSQRLKDLIFTIRYEYFLFKTT